MVDEQAKVERRRKPSQLAWRWHFFWMRHSGWRTAWALILAIPPLLALIYLALPATAQAPVVAALQAAGQSLGATGLRVAVEVALAACALASLALLLTPGYRTARYLHAPTQAIPQVTVYLDAENIVTEQQIPAFLDHLRLKLGGRRADLLYFVDVWETHSRPSYATLSRYGFRPIHAAHNPTGVKRMWEAVDREIALHALERGLVGPAGQEYIIISNDGDYAPLIMRLVALGHSAQVWSTTTSAPYRVLETYLNAFPASRFRVEDLAPVMGVAPSAIDPAEQRDETRQGGLHTVKKTTATRKRRNQRAHASQRAQASLVAVPLPAVEQPRTLTREAERQLYYAIAETLAIWRHCEKRAPTATDDARDTMFTSALGETLGPRLSGIGYLHGSRVEYWRSHLVAIGVLEAVAGARFLQPGGVSAEEGARRLFALVAATVRASVRALPNRPDGYVNMGALLAPLMTEKLSGAAGDALATLLNPQDGRRSSNARYLVHCARALGLVAFSDKPMTPDLITRPRLTALGEQVIAQMAEGSQVAPPEAPKPTS